MLPIEEFSSDALIQELSKRYGSFIMAGRKELNNSVLPADECAVETKRYWNGDLEVCCGLAQGILIGCTMKRWGVHEEDVIY